MSLRPAPSRASAEAWRIVATVADSEVPVPTIEDLGVLRAADVVGNRVHVEITPTYTGCPAIDVIRDDIVLALTAADYAEVDVRLTLSPVWTTDWMTDAGRRKLEEYGIAPPNGHAAITPEPLRLALSVHCPPYGSLDTREVSRFSSTACKALFECRTYLEAFDHFKVH